jgi:hypothetical protein
MPDGENLSEKKRARKNTPRIAKILGFYWSMNPFFM